MLQRRDFEFQLFRPFLQLLFLLPGVARQRQQRAGMFAHRPSEADRKLYEMYAKFNARLAVALLDHNFTARLEELPISAPGCKCLRPCC